MREPDANTLSLIRVLIPYVYPIRDNNPDEFPEGYCDVASAQLTFRYNIPGLRHRCGQLGDFKHIWVQDMPSGMNIDFTAHQFPSLRPYISVVDGFEVLFGSDAFFESVGFVIYSQAQCYQQLLNAGIDIGLGDFGNCKPTSCHWARP